MISINAVPIERLESVWPMAKSILRRAVAKAPDDVDLDVVYDGLLRGRILLVTIVKESEIIAVHTLEIRKLDTGKKALYIPITAGDNMDEWIDEFLVLVETLARERNCISIRGGSPRAGWLRKLKPYGWEPISTIFEKKL